jgi:MFS transporter, DHA3 family, macrolide efflux protein
MPTFVLIWFGQLVSILGSAMTAFALTIWAWQVTGQATSLALMSFATFAPSVLVSPLAGAIIDRWNRKQLLVLSDLAQGCVTIGLLLLSSSNNLALWHLYVAAACVSLFQAFQAPAYETIITTLLPKQVSSP